MTTNRKTPTPTIATEHDTCSICLGRISPPIPGYHQDEIVTLGVQVAHYDCYLTSQRVPGRRPVRHQGNS